MNGRDFLNSARRLAAGPDESDWRSAVSRAYYAAFHVARDLLAALGFQTPRADRAHNYLYARLNNSGDAGVEDVAKRLHELRRRRNQADYDLLPPLPRQDAASYIAMAERVVQSLDTLTPAQRTRITDAMKLYEQGVGDVTWQP